MTIDYRVLSLSTTHWLVSSWSVEKPCSIIRGNGVEFFSRTCTSFLRRRKPIFISYFNLQLMVVGQVGVDGLHAPVESLLHNVLEAACDRRLVMVANLALDVG